MARRGEKKKRFGLGRALATGLLAYGAVRGYRAYKGVRKVTKIGKTVVAVGATTAKTKAVRKIGRWKTTLTKPYNVIGKKNGTRIQVNRRGIGMTVNVAKRRRPVWGSKRIIKAGPAARSAFKKATRGAKIGKVRSPSYAFTRRR